MTTQLSHTDPRVDDAPWHVRIAVVWRDEQLPVPIGENARAVAAAAGVSLTTRPGSCIAHYAINAASLGEAIPRALTKWSTVVEEAALPNWETVSFSLDQVDETELSLSA